MNTQQEKIHKLVSELKLAQVHIVYVSSHLQRTHVVRAIDNEITSLEGHYTVNDSDFVTVMQVRQLKGVPYTATIEVHMTACIILDLSNDGLYAPFDGY